MMKKLILIFIFLFIPLTSLSQNISTKDSLIYLNDTIPFSGRYIEKYDNGSIKSYTDIENGKINGQYVLFYKSSKYTKKKHIKEIRTYKDGIKDGYFITSYKNNVVESRSYYVNGKKDGNWVVYNPDGNIIYIMRYDNGKKVGKWLIKSPAGYTLKVTDFNRY